MNPSKLLLPVLALSLLAPAAAQAGTVEVSGTQLRITGDPDADVVSVARNSFNPKDSELTVTTRDVTSQTAGPGCTPVPGPPLTLVLKFTCVAPGAFSRIVADLGGGSDSFGSSFARGVPVTVTGGQGGDGIAGGNRGDRIDGGADGDKIKGGAGNDLLDAGDDPFTTNVIGEVEIVDGEAGNDTILGDGGRESLRGGDGDDLIDAVDGRTDGVGCGRGTDLAVIDLTDFVGTGFFASCENVFKAPVGEHPTVKLRSSKVAVSSRGVAKVKLSCPSKNGCKGTLRIKVGSKTVGKKRYSIGARKRKTVSVRVGRNIARKVAGKRTLRASAFTSERDSKGRPKTTATRSRCASG
jgi:hypothetical protein